MANAEMNILFASQIVHRDIKMDNCLIFTDKPCQDASDIGW